MIAATALPEVPDIPAWVVTPVAFGFTLVATIRLTRRAETSGTLWRFVCGRVVLVLLYLSEASALLAIGSHPYSDNPFALLATAGCSLLAVLLLSVSLPGFRLYAAIAGFIELFWALGNLRMLIGLGGLR